MVKKQKTFLKNSRQYDSFKKMHQPLASTNYPVPWRATYPLLLYKGGDIDITAPV